MTLPVSIIILNFRWDQLEGKGMQTPKEPVRPSDDISLLFEKRITSPARAKSCLPFKPVDSHALAVELGNLLLSDPGTDERVLYIHLPFCRQNCSFCGYYKETGCDDDRIGSYVTQLVEQLKRLGSFNWVKYQPFSAIYFGGGSPSSLGFSQLSALLDAVRRFIPLAPDAEITMELTVHDSKPEYAEHLVQSGVNRVSLGVQSFNTQLRRSIGRISSEEEVRRAILYCGEAGLTNLCIDLIYNLPGQTMKGWEADLKMLDTLPVSGCSVYPLIPFPNARLVVSGGYPVVEAKTDFEFFRLADDYLSCRNNWTAYSPVQYGDRDTGKPIYILAQGKQADLLALGPSAGGRINRYQYLSKFPLDDCFAASFDFLMNSSWSAIDPEYLKYRRLFTLSEGPGISEMEPCASELMQNDDMQRYIASGLIEKTGGFYRLSRSGRYHAGNISERISRHILEKIT
jgi:oxygen-independent coproporphyrinogen-3 oxidase